MQPIEIYYKKIDRMLKARESTPKQKGKGLLSPSGTPKPTNEQRDQGSMQIIAEIVDGIRQARKEMMNGK
jgi:hypothetical protein